MLSHIAGNISQRRLEDDRMRGIILSIAVIAYIIGGYFDNMIE